MRVFGALLFRRMNTTVDSIEEKRASNLTLSEFNLLTQEAKMVCWSSLPLGFFRIVLCVSMFFLVVQIWGLTPRGSPGRPGGEARL